MRGVPSLLIIALALPLILPLSEDGTAQTPLTQEPCPDAPEPELFLPWDAQLENLAFDGDGNMWLSDFGNDRLVRVAHDGTWVDGSSFDGLHGLVFGPDGWLYVGALGAAGDWQVWRSPDPLSDAFEVYATGFSAVNGMAFDSDGDLYVSDPLGDSRPYLMRLPAGDPQAWTEWSDIYGPNGLFYDPLTDTLFTAVTGDQSSPILQVTLDENPKDFGLTTLSWGVLTLQPGWHKPHGPATVLAPKGLDDLTLHPDGMVYVTAHLTGELVRVDPVTLEACIVASGLLEPTSVRVADGFGPYDGDLFVTTMGGVGVTGLLADTEGAVFRIPMP